MTVTATPSRAAGTPAAAGATATGPAGAGATGFGDLLAALVPGASSTLPVPGAAGATDVLPAMPSGVCGAGPEVSVSPEDVVVGATDPALVVVGAAGDDAAGSRTGDPAEVAGEGEPAAGTTTDPSVESALLAQAQLAALPLLASAVTAPAGPAAGPATDQPDAVAAAPATTAPAGTTTDATAASASVAPTDDATGADGGSAGADSSRSDGGGSGSGAAGQPQAPTTTAAAPATADAAPRVDAAASVSAPATVAPPVATAPVRGAARPVDAVPGQVFPEVVRLSQSGPGTHRVTLRLDPGTLGEVRVTLTVRDGEVQVRLAAQHDAREVLAHAAPELRRMLEQSGTVDARVAVADLASGTTTDQSGGPDQRGAGTSGERGEDARRPSSYDEQRRSAPRADPGPADAERPRDAGSRSGLDLAL